MFRLTSSADVVSSNSSNGVALQVVGFTQIRNYDSVFKVVPTDPAQRIASEGVEVLAGVPLCIQHCSTHAMLCLEGAVHHNEFGSERELSCRVVHSNGRKLILCHEQAGKLTNTLPSHPAEANHFHFVVGTTVGQLPEPEYVPYLSCFTHWFRYPPC
jgi:hypothetical protein